MSVEAMVGLIERESAEEAARLIADASAKARSIEEAAAANARAQVDAALERAEPALRAEEQRAVNAARLRLLERRAEIVAERVGAVFDAAAVRLAAIADGADPERWGRAIAALATDALVHVGHGATILVRAPDAAALDELVRSESAAVEAVDGMSGPAGLVVRSADGRLEVDALVATRLDRARTRLAEPVVRLVSPAPEGAP
jgi:vacuolar-type H+-ATPase subunit E/Vma4